MAREEDSLSELLEAYQDQEELYSFGGDSGVKKLEQIFGVLGYTDKGFGSATREFLSDNPGAMEAILTWIGEQNLSDWKQRFIENLEDEEPLDDDEEEDDDVPL